MRRVAHHTNSSGDRTTQTLISPTTIIADEPQQTKQKMRRKVAKLMLFNNHDSDNNYHNNQSCKTYAEHPTTLNKQNCSSDSNDEKGTSKRQKRLSSIQRDRKIGINDHTTSQINEPDCLRLSVYEKFIRHFFQIFNDHDSMSMLYLVFYPCCSPTLVNILRYWSRNNPLLPPTVNPTGWFNYEEFHGFNDITNHCRVAFCMNPDLTTTVRSINIIPVIQGNQRNEMKAFVSFDGWGTSIIPANEVLLHAFEARKKTLAEQHTVIQMNPPSFEELKHDEIHRCYTNLYRYNLQTISPQSVLTDEMPPISNMSPQQLQALINKINEKESTTALSSSNTTDDRPKDQCIDDMKGKNTKPHIRRCGEVFLMDLNLKGYLIINFDGNGKVYRMETHYFEQSPSS